MSIGEFYDDRARIIQDRDLSRRLGREPHQDLSGPGFLSGFKRVGEFVLGMQTKLRDTNLGSM